MKRLSILGSTGSIGDSTLKLIRKNPEDFKIIALAAGKNCKKLAEQIDEFGPTCVSIQDESDLTQLQMLCKSDISNIQFLFGSKGAEHIASLPEVNLVVSAIVGSAGLKPTLAAIEASKTIALANKESLVVAGAYVMKKAQEKKAHILPVDSEHSAIFQCLKENADRSQLRKIILTASGGPFFKNENVNFDQVSVEEALRHPNWSMGKKITIDSATMFNKGLEAIEAKWLFDLNSDQIDVVVHPQSIVHSMVEFNDGSILSQMGIPDMQGPISHALAHPYRIQDATDRLDFSKSMSLEFLPPNHERFPSIRLALQTLEMSPLHPAVLNGANESSVAAFLNRKISFSDIFKINKETILRFEPKNSDKLEDFIEADQWGRLTAQQLIT